MGWCSGTDIMDATIRAALDLLYPRTQPAEVDRHGPLTDKQRDQLGPFVAKVAEKLRDGDWDCIDESDFFDDFPQEMLGLDDHEFSDWKREQLSDWDGTPSQWPRWAGAVPAVVCDPKVSV